MANALLHCEGRRLTDPETGLLRHYLGADLEIFEERAFGINRLDRLQSLITRREATHLLVNCDLNTLAAMLAVVNIPVLRQELYPSPNGPVITYVTVKGVSVVTEALTPPWSSNPTCPPDL